MKIAAVSNPDGAADRVARLRKKGYIVFVYDHADPNHLIFRNKFPYVCSDEELVEKMNLIAGDMLVVEEYVRM